MENGEYGAFACASDGAHQAGLTKREYFAGLAMQALIANGKIKDSDHNTLGFMQAVIYADDLLNELSLSYSTNVK